jgi:hypothetical protein
MPVVDGIDREVWIEAQHPALTVQSKAYTFTIGDLVVTCSAIMGYGPDRGLVHACVSQADFAAIQLVGARVRMLAWAAR